MAKDEMPIQDELKLQVNQLLSEEQELRKTADELGKANPGFVNFLKHQQEFQKKSDAFWKKLEKDMIDNDVKSIKSKRWGSITIAEKTTYKATDIDEVPSKFVKKALDTKKVGAQFSLSGKLPKGVVAAEAKYLTKRINIKEIDEE